MHIPLVDLTRQIPEIRDEIQAKWSAVLDSSAFILGAEVAEFERAFAAYCRAQHCVGVGNGTDAIELALRAAGVGDGDEVIVPANTFMATALAVLRAGARVQLVDCEPGTYLIDPEQVERRAGSKTRAILPVHLFGQMAATEVLKELFPDLILIEDAAQAHGSQRHGNAIGSQAIAATTSFYPAKNLGAFGDAGAVVTDDEWLAASVRALHNWGSDRKYHHPVAGFNSRLDTLQAVVLSAKLGHLDEWNRQRREAAHLYDELLLNEARIALPRTAPGNLHVFHLYVVEVDRREDVLRSLHEAGIGAGIHYPVPLHLQGALKHLGHDLGDFPVSENAARRMISLPIFPGITTSEQEWVVDSLLAAVA
jgi:dTDP-4-amino-4,6-dideoxygalactose transaminase